MDENSQFNRPYEFDWTADNRNENVGPLSIHLTFKIGLISSTTEPYCYNGEMFPYEAPACHLYYVDAT